MLEIELIQVTLGLRDSLSRVPSEKEWDALFAFAERHSLMGVLFDGVEKTLSNSPLKGEDNGPMAWNMSVDLLMEWYGQAQYQRQDYEAQRRAVESLVRLWEAAGLHVVELKGDSIGRFYPNPAMRYSCDFDSFLLKITKTEKTASAEEISALALASDACASPCESKLSQIESQSSSAAKGLTSSTEVKNIASPKNIFIPAYEDGNKVVEMQGVEVNRDFYKNSSFVWNGLHVENHQFCTPVRGSKRMKRFERTLRNLLFEPLITIQYHSEPKTALAQFNSLFLMEHMWAHFFEEALTMKQVCDWVVFRKECSQDVDWQAFESAARDCGFWEFAKAMNKIAGAILELRVESLELSEAERRLWECVLEGGGSIEMNRGWRTRVQMVRNFFRNGWKYRYFHNHSAMYVLARTAWAFVFEKAPKI